MPGKICHVTSAHQRYDDRIFEKECRTLTSNYEVHLLVNDKLNDEITENVHIHSMKLSFKNRLERICGGKNFLKKALEIDADIYHLHDPELLLIALKLLKNNKKVIFDSHEYYYEQIKAKTYIPAIFRSAIAILYRAYETYVCKKIDGVISICPLRKDNIVYNPFKGRCKRHEYVANYPVFRDLRCDGMHETNEFKVCYAGGLTHERGITYLIDACYLAGCKLILAGTFSSEEYKSRLQKKESYKCVDYRGQCTAKEVFDIYRSANLGASTLLDYGQYFKIETFPVKVYEYFQMQLPVLISNYPYAEEMNKKYKFGIVVRPNDINEMANTIKFIKHNRDRCSILGSNGKKLYKEKLNWEKESEKLFSLYDEIGSM